MFHFPRKRFGQHFLNDPYIIQQIVWTVNPEPAQHIIEIGPGKGALTSEFLALYPNLTALEIDRDLVNYLTQKYKNLKIIQADALKFDFSQLPSPLRIIGNLPYNISTPLLFHLLNYKNHIHDMVFMLQKEVVTRLCADVNTKNYGRLSVMLQREFYIDHLFDVPKEAFLPPPKVTSAMVRFSPIADQDKPFLASQKKFEEIVRICFQYRRKTLRNILKNLSYNSPEILSLNIDLNSRPENLSVENYIALANTLSGF